MRIPRLALCAAALFASALPGLAEEAARKPVTLTGPDLYYLDHWDVSPPLGEMPILPPSWEPEQHPVKTLPHHHPADAPSAWPDPALQTRVEPLVGVTPGLNFDGVGVPNYTITGAPPDTNGAAGATQYVHWVNVAFAVFDKTTGAMTYGPAGGNTLWQGFGGRCETDNSGDPIVMYDKPAGRWVMTQFAVSASPYYQCVAVSTTSDALGTWRRFSYSFGSDFNDYPKGGVWPDAYYITFNMFAGGVSFIGAKACALDRNQMITASGVPGPIQCFQLSATYGGLLPADLDGTTAPPAGAPNYHLAFDDIGRNGLNLWKFHADWGNPSASTFTGPTKITGLSFTEACGGGTCITQPGTSQKLDSLADRLMHRLAYRNFGSHESLVVNHSVDAGGGISGVRWYEVRAPGGTPVIHQQGTFSPDTNHRWMGSIGMDGSGNMLVGYSASGVVKPSVRITGRLATDALNTMQSETEMYAGLGVQTTGLSRWGDYSAMTIDPVDDCTFWYTTEYLKTNGTFNWSTRVGTFEFPTCGAAPSPDFTIAASPGSLTIEQGGSGTSTITITSLNGFSSATTLSASGLPSGVTASFSPNPVTPPAGGSAGSTLTLSATTSAATGTFTVTVTGASGSLTHSTTISLTVNAAGTAVYDSALKAPKCANVGSVCDSGALLNGRASLGPEPNQPNTINNSCADGTSGIYHDDESNDRIRVFTSDGTSFAPGKTVTFEATVWAWSTGSSDTLDFYYAADAANPVWTYITSKVSPGGDAQLLTATYTLPSGTLQAVRANFRYQGSASSCSTGTYDDHDDLIFAVGSGGGDITPPTTSITAPANGATVSGTTTITASASDNVGVTKVEFYIDSALVSTDTASPYSYDWNTTTYPNGAHTIFSKASDAAGNVGTSSTISVTVANNVEVTVFYDGTESANTQLTFTNVTSSTKWIRQASAPYAGTYRWRCGGSTGGNYGNNGDARMTTPALDLSGATTATLTYAFKHSTELNYDFFEVRISTDGGTNWTNFVHVSGNSSGWSGWAPLATIDLTPYVGLTNVKLQWRLYTDVSITGWGAAVDEITVTKK